MGDGGSLGLAWFHFGLTSSHLVSLGLTWSHLVHLVSLGLTWSHLVSLGLTWLRLASLGLMASREKGSGPGGKREKGTGQDAFWARDSTVHPERARRRTKRNDFPVGLTPPTSDLALESLAWDLLYSLGSLAWEI